MEEIIAPVKQKNTCEICDSIFYKPYNLRRHMVNIHGYKVDELKAHNSNVLTHISSILTQNSNKITHNSSILTQDSNLINVTDESVKTFECSKCKKTFSRDWSLKRHMEKCQGIKDKFSCQYCNKLFSHEKSRFKHYKICIAKKEINSKALIIPEPLLRNVPIITNNIDTQNIQTQNNIKTQNNNQNIILVYNPDNMEFIKDHIGEEAVEYIKGLYPKVDRRIVMDYSKRILNLPENQCIKKDDLKSGHSKVHIGDNEWEKITDNSIYPKLACTMANNMSDYLYTKRNKLRKETFEKIMSFVDYMSDEGYINTEDKEKEKKILQEFKSFVRELKLIVFNKTKEK